MLQDAESVYCEAFAAGIKPDPIRSVSSWAEEFRFLSQKASSEAGPWRNARTPYLVEIQDCLSTDSPYEEIVFKKGAQVGGTECAFNWLGYIIHHSPGPTMMVQPTVDLAKRASKQRLDPMIQECPVLCERVAESKSRNSGNTMLSKEFPGGVVILAGANSAAGLRSMPAKYLLLDEIDAYPDDVDGEGSPVELAERRTSTFARRKKFKISTPTIKGQSKISKAFADSDQRYFHVPCPHCKEMQVLKWENIKWQKHSDGKPDFASVRLECIHCKALIEEFHKTWMLANGKWVATSEPVSPKTVGFHLSALYSPVGWYSWASAVEDFYKAKGDPTKLRVFINTVLGEEFEVKGTDTPEWKSIYHRRELFPIGTVPIQACLLTAACDVQKDRIECGVWAWNRREAWFIDHIVMFGDTSQIETWSQVDEILAREYPHASGSTMQIKMMLIDSGFNTNTVYEYVRTRDPRRVRAIKGQEKLSVPIGSPKLLDVKFNGKRLARGVRLWPVGTDLLKSDLYARLKIDKPTDEAIAKTGYPSAYIHFPMFGEDFFKQLVAEQLILVSKKKGFAKYEWMKTGANEVLDLSVYNIAAYYGVGAHRFTDNDWKRLASEVGAKGEQVKPAEISRPSETKKPAETKAKRKTQRGSSIW